MRILFNLSGAPSLSSNRGGAIEKLVADLTEYMAGSHEVTVFGELSPLDRRVQLVPFSKRMVLNWESMPGNISFMARGLPKILAVDADVIVSSHPRNLLLSLLYSKRKGSPLVSWELDHDPWVPPWTLIKRLHQHLVSKAHLVITMSGEQLRRMTARGIDPGRISLVSHSVNANRYRPARPGNGDPYLLYVAKFVPRKNQLELIEAFSKLSSEHEDLRLVLVGPRSGAFNSSRRSGGSAYYRRCIDLIRDKDLENRVALLERLTEEELVRFYQGCTLYMFPSLEEGFGLTLLEAMSCGCACISSNIEPMPEVLGDAGVLYEPGDAGRLAKLVDGLLTDDRERVRLEARARDRATSSFNPENVHRRLSEKIVRLLS